jgi:recombination protein RecR
MSEEALCEVCRDPRRDPGLLCVVEEPADVLAFERTGAWGGLYHVLGGALSPLRDMGPDDLHIAPLLERVQREAPREVVLATNPNVEGEATAVYLARLLKPMEVLVTRLAQGVPAGGDLEWVDDLTLRRAFEGRRDY